DVVEYIKYTKRLPLTQKFDSTDLEFELYTKVSEFLRSDNLYSIPAKQKMLTTMMVRKILASSTYALLGTLATIKARLEKMLEENKYPQFDLNEIFDEDEIELLNENEEDNIDSDDNSPTEDEIIDTKQIQKEIAAIQSFINLAEQIKHDSKAKALLIALQKAFEQIELIGANRKALIFTESKRTQAYLKEFLEQNGYKGKIVTFNGSNSDRLKANAYTGKISGIRAADRRAAIVDYFKDKAEIMIATEAAAEGLNLQFCSLVVNYDLPWNPQRIEQRIGRCHRYGQKSDVVVVNFVNQRNEADRRVLELLEQKFNLFSGVFGASDEVLGTIESGVDFEKRILAIYQACRTPEEIDAAFKALQAEMEEQIRSRLEDTRRALFEHFDEDVHERLRMRLADARARLDRVGRRFWSLTRHVLADQARFDDIAFT